MSGLLNYYGRTPESDNIHIKPVLLQKGGTKLALFGLSNVRDERLFRTFRDGNVKIFRPGTQRDDWFNLMSVHQNHHAYTDTGFLPETFLPSFMDLIIWGHEHECLIEPRTNAETGFKVIQPGSSVATSLVPGEAEPKHVAILSITGKEFRVEPIRLTSVRPFVMKEISLKDSQEMRDVAERPENRTKVNQYLTSIVEELIEEANQSWLEAQQKAGVEMDEDTSPPLPLIRLRVDHTPPEGGSFEIENPQRFSNRFVGKVANVSDVVQYHRKRTTTRPSNAQPDMPEDSIMAQLTIDSVKVDKLVKEFLTAQSLTILPQNSFSDAVGQYVDKDDKHAMEEFLTDSLRSQVESLLAGGDEDEDFEANDQKMVEAIENNRVLLEQSYAKGELKRIRRKGARKPKPDYWDSDMDGHWEDSMLSLVVADNEAGDDNEEVEEEEQNVETNNRAPAKGKTSRAKPAGKAAATKAQKSAPATKAASAKSTASASRKKQPFEEDDEDEDNDVIMLNDEEEEGDGLFVEQPKKKAPAAPATRQSTKSPAKKPAARGGKPATSASATRGGQTRLSFPASQNTSAGSNGSKPAAAAKRIPARRLQEPSEDEISDDDAFEPPPMTQRSKR